MLTYQLKKQPGLPLYEALYRCIREDIRTGRLRPGEQLPSKRSLCANLKVSKITVENAYNQLLAEGYISSREKVGYFVEAVQQLPPQTPKASQTPPPEGKLLDLSGNGSPRFPFTVWSRLQRQVLLDYGQKLLLPLPNQGIGELRQAIAWHLGAFRGLEVNPEDIFVGAGTDFLYNLLVQLLGRDKCYGVEEPGYSKIYDIYRCAGARCTLLSMDKSGVLPDAATQVLHISPAHHFPTGLVTPLSRRRELLRWASAEDGRYIIEDDYDSEFRFAGRPLPTLKAMDTAGRVIYMNSFTKSLAPSIRISYMILPSALMAALQTRLGFYAGTVPSFEQYTLARFIREGYFEKHINRMRKFYKARRDTLLELVAQCPRRLQVLEEGAGLHFLLRVDTELTDPELVAACAQKGLKVRCLSQYYRESPPENCRGYLVINYSGLGDADIEVLAKVIKTL